MRRRLSYLAFLLGACSESFPAELRAPDPATDAAAPSDASPADATTADAATDAPVETGSTVKGDVWFPDAGAPSQTSVLLARVTDYELNAFHDKLPEGPRTMGVTGAWSISDVPPGTYWVLAGYANDGFVSASPAPAQVNVSGARDEVAVAGTQFLFRAIKIATITPKASNASVTIVDTEGEDEYRVTVVDFMNKLVYSNAEPPSETGASVTFAIGKILTVPIRYRVRVVAMKGGVELTRTEDLAGLFTAQPDDT